MKLFKPLLALLPVLAIMGVIACGKQSLENQMVVAQIGDNHKISFQDLQSYVINNFYNRMYRDPLQAHNKALDVMIINQLKRIDFVAKGLQNDEALVNRIRRTINEELLVKYFDSQFSGKYTSDEYVQQTYKNMAREVVYKQVVLYKPENATETDISNLKKQAIDIKTQIDQGADFGEMVRQYSQHAESVKNDGLVPPLRWKNRIANFSFKYIFYQNVNDVLLFETNREFCIVKIVKINQLDVEPLEKIKNEIIADLKKDYMEKSLDEYDQMKDKLVDESSFIWNQKALNQVTQWSKTRMFNEDAYKAKIMQAIAHGENPVILSYSNGKIDFKEYLRLVNDILIPTASVDITDKNIKDYIAEAIRTDIIVRKAKELGLDKDIFDPKTTNTVIQAKMVMLYNQVFIDAKVPEPSETELLKFFEDQKDSLFYQLAKVNIHAAIFSDKAGADQVWAQIQQGKTFHELIKSYLVKTFIKTRDGQVRSFLTDETPFLGEAAFRLQESQTDGVIEYNDPEKGAQFAIIKCTNVRPEKQLTFTDVQNTIHDEYRKFTRAQIETQVERELLNTWPAKIYPDVLQKNIAAK